MDAKAELHNAKTATGTFSSLQSRGPRKQKGSNKGHTKNRGVVKGENAMFMTMRLFFFWPSFAKYNRSPRLRSGLRHVLRNAGPRASLTDRASNCGE